MAASSASAAAPPSASAASDPSRGSADGRRAADQRRSDTPLERRSRGARAERMPDGKPVGIQDAPIGGQAVLEGVMMRGVSTWAVAVRNPEGEIETTSEPIVSWAKRHRVLRWPVIRGVVALGESLKIGFRALAISANAQLPEDEHGEKEEIGGLHVGPDDRPLAGARGRALLRHPGRRHQPDQGLARLGPALLAGRGGPADRDLHRLHRRDQPAARPAPRVRVPRRRAQDDLLLRGRRGADARERRAATRGCTRAAAPASC